MSTSIAQISAVHWEGVRALTGALRRIERTFGQASRSFILFGWYARAHGATERYGLSWQLHHPGRRLPGSMRNRRLAKKRAQYLERWAREVGL